MNKTNMKDEKQFNLPKNAITMQTLIILIAVIVITAILTMCSDGESAVLASIVIPGVAGGKHIVDGPLTTDIVHKESDILVNEIDRRIVKIRPMATPIDQLSRYAGAKHAKSMIVDYYSVDTKPTIAEVTEDHIAPVGEPVSNIAELKVNTPELFEPTETILVRGVKGYKADGTEIDPNSELVLYVVDKTPESIKVIAVNGVKTGAKENCLPKIDTGTLLVRMGRAATELDVQTAQFESLPVKAQNYCQIFKMQIEQSTFQKIAGKEVDWDFSDQEEAAIYDMRLGMEKNFLFGTKRRITDPLKKEEVMFTQGIWFQAGKTFRYSTTAFTQDTLIEMMRQSFTGNAGNKRKVLIGGSALIEAINKLDFTKVVNVGDNVEKWGIDFSEIRSKFGKFYVLLSEVFDDCGMEACGMVIDPEYIQKYSHLPFGTESLNLKSAGIRNTDALVLTEASCITLRYPTAHMRITPMNI